MRELWNASHGAWPYDHNHPLLSIWWVLWLVNSVSTNVAVRFETGFWVITEGVSGAFLAIAAIILVRGIALAQSQLGDQALSEVFA